MTAITHPHHHPHHDENTQDSTKKHPKKKHDSAHHHPLPLPSPPQLRPSSPLSPESPTSPNSSFSPSFEETSILLSKKLTLRKRLLGATLAAVVFANAFTNDKDSSSSDALKTGGFILANVIVSFLDKSCPSMRHLGQKVMHAGSGFFVMMAGNYVGGSLSENPEHFWKAAGAVLINASSILGANLVHYFNHKHYNVETKEEQEEEKPLKKSHRKHYAHGEVV